MLITKHFMCSFLLPYPYQLIVHRRGRDALYSASLKDSFKNQLTDLHYIYHYTFLKEFLRKFQFLWKSGLQK